MDSAERQRRFEQGLGVLEKLHGHSGLDVIEALAEVSPELAHQTVAWGYGEIYSRPQLAARDRQLVTLGILTALGGCEPQLEVHINAALNAGLTQGEVIETLLHTAVYCGFPRALNATLVAGRVFSARAADARSA
ncbi:carboxymuconolactone decarboxylase family protein [Microbacterium sp. VKM Ac-2870]|nr:carboxymuconolactone decarboxylase family protein [Microbacterium sp. VKM Ac-2870]